MAASSRAETNATTWHDRTNYFATVPTQALPVLAKAFCAAPTFDAERALWRRIFTSGRVNVSPGAIFHCAEPGWFRLCFASDHTVVREGVTRLARTLAPTRA